jgi:hypothetical protein
VERTDRFYDNNTVVLRMGGNLNNRGPGQMEERTSLVDEVAYEPEDYSSCKSAKKVARRSRKAAPRNPQNREWGLYRVLKATETVETGENKDERELKGGWETNPLSQIGKCAIPI